MTTAEDLNYTAVADVHGRYELVARMVEEEIAETDRFVFVGDVIDGPKPQAVVDLIVGLGDKAVTLTGNHEWILQNALQDSDGSLTGNYLTEKWRKEIWSVYEKGMLLSYGVKYSSDWDSNAVYLRETMAEQGHLDWLGNLPPYYATPRFVAVHAGPIANQPWVEQQAALDEASKPEMRVLEEPEQIFSYQHAIPGQPPLAVNDDRLFVSGHAHVTLPAEERALGQRVHLASKFWENEPLFIWRSRDQQIVTYEEAKT